MTDLEKRDNSDSSSESLGTSNSQKSNEFSKSEDILAQPSETNPEKNEEHDHTEHETQKAKQKIRQGDNEKESENGNKMTQTIFNV